MKMVGHDHMDIGVNRWEFLGQLKPPTLNQPPCIIHLHLPIRYLAKQTLPTVGADSHKICSSLGIIVTLQADRTAVVMSGVVLGHY